MAGNAPLTPPPTVEKERSLYEIPEISPLFIKQYASTETNVPIKDPQSFSLRPPAWFSWSLAQYERLYGYVRANVDLLPFAEQEGLSLQEVEHVFEQTIGLDFQNKGEKIKKHKNKCMFEMLAQYNKHAEPYREWTARKVNGVLWQIKVGEIELVSQTGTSIPLQRRRLTDDDLAYIKKHSSERQWYILMLDREKGDVEAMEIDD